jgi:tRNA(Ile)-lysidine synthase
MELLRHFQDALRAMGIAQGQRVVVGVSGGPDSLALLHLFVQSRESLGIVPTAAHVHHGIRGEAADADASFMADIGQEWRVDCRIERVDVPALARDHGYSLEEAARKARYSVMSQIASEVGAEILAVAHHADDQAETILLHLLRGAGLAGLRGMLPVTTLSAAHVLGDLEAGLTIIRPLLDIPREDILAYCDDHGLRPRIDETNDELSLLRNRVRHTIMPMLRELRPSLSQQLGQTARLLQADFDALEMQINEAWKELLVQNAEGAVSLHRDRWKALPLALRRGTIRRAVAHLTGSTENVSFQHAENAVQVGMNGNSGAQASLPNGMSLTVGYDVLRIALPDHEPAAPDWPLLATGTMIPLEMGVLHSLGPDSEWGFIGEVYEGPREGAAWEAILRDRWQVVIDADSLPEAGIASLSLRTRRPGDRLQPQGVDGTQKLSDFLINAKVPAIWRDRLPLLVTGPEGKLILWVCGFRTDARFVVRPTTQRVVALRFERLPPTG